MSSSAGWVWKVAVVPSTIRQTVKLWLRLETQCGERTSISSRQEQSMSQYITSALYSACMACKLKCAYSFVTCKYPPSAEFYESYGIRIKCSVEAAGDRNLNDSCVTKVFKCRHLNLTLSTWLCDNGAPDVRNQRLMWCCMIWGFFSSGVWSCVIG